MYGSNVMAKFAKAAEIGGACMIRATGYDNIKAIQENCSLDILGINKVFSESSEVYITPTYSDAKLILDLGIKMIALDATDRKRPKESYLQIVELIRINYPGVLIVGEIGSLSDLDYALEAQPDYISTTLFGYTDESKDYKYFDPSIITYIKRFCPVIAEGKIHNPELAKAALDAGADYVVVGNAITIPEAITKRFVEALN